MEAAIGWVAFIGGLAAINWAIHAFMRWIPELARRDRGTGRGGGLRRRRPHPRPDGSPTGQGPHLGAQPRRPIVEQHHSGAEV